MKRIRSSWGTFGATCRLDLPKVQLEISRDTAILETREIRAAVFLIGAAHDCDLVLAGPQFAAVHSYLLLSPQRVTVRHLGFGPRLCMAGQDVTWAVLSHNDQLRFGPYTFQVRIQWPERAATGFSVRTPHAASLFHTDSHPEAAKRSFF